MYAVSVPPVVNPIAVNKCFNVNTNIATPHNYGERFTYIIRNSGMLEGGMPVITNYPIACTRFLLNAPIL